MTDPTEFAKFDKTVKKILSVSRIELAKREKEWKQEQAHKKRGKQVKVPPKPNHVAAAITAFKRAAKAMKDNPKLQVPY